MKKTQFDVNADSRRYQDYKFKDMSYWQKIKEVSLTTFMAQVPGHAIIVGARYGLITTAIWFLVTLIWTRFSTDYSLNWSINQPLFTPETPYYTAYLLLFIMLTIFFASCTFINRSMERSASLWPVVLFTVPAGSLLYQLGFLSDFYSLNWQFSLAVFLFAIGFGMTVFMLLIDAMMIYFLITEDPSRFFRKTSKKIKKLTSSLYFTFAEWLLGRDIDFKNPL